MSDDDDDEYKIHRSLRIIIYLYKRKLTYDIVYLLHTSTTFLIVVINIIPQQVRVCIRGTSRHPLGMPTHRERGRERAAS